jgi:hypothetical protein
MKPGESHCFKAKAPGWADAVAEAVRVLQIVAPLLVYSGRSSFCVGVPVRSVLRSHGARPARRLSLSRRKSLRFGVLPAVGPKASIQQVRSDR